MSLTEEMANPARIMFCIGRDDLYKVRVDNIDLDHFLRVLLRLYEGLFSGFREINELEIAHWSGYTLHKVQDLLKRLWQMRIIRYVPSNQSPLIYLDVARLPKSDIYISPDSYTTRRQLTEERFSHMLAYANNENTCRSRLFEEYFAVESSGDCNVCDICLEKRKRNRATSKGTEEQILSLLGDKQLTIKELVAMLKLPSNTIVVAVDTLLDKGIISESKDGRLSLC